MRMWPPRHVRCSNGQPAVVPIRRRKGKRAFYAQADLDTAGAYVYATEVMAETSQSGRWAGDHARVRGEAAPELCRARHEEGPEDCLIIQPGGVTRDAPEDPKVIRNRGDRAFPYHARGMSTVPAHAQIEQPTRPELGNRLACGWQGRLDISRLGSMEVPRAHGIGRDPDISRGCHGRL